jgi:hypothetical protein
VRDDSEDKVFIPGWCREGQQMRDDSEDKVFIPGWCREAANR